MPRSSTRSARARFVVAAVALLSFSALLFALGTIRGTTSYDDCYITYTYAASLARGDGLTWNGAGVLGTSTPFLAVVLAGLEAIWPLGVPVWGAVVSWVAVGVAALAILALGRREGWERGAMFAAAALPLSAFVHHHVGSEMLPAVAAVTAAAALLSRDRWIPAGLALALAVAFRAESGVAAFALAATFFAHRRRRGEPVAKPFVTVAASSALSIGLWTAALFAIAGAIVPSTLAAKRAQAESALRIWRSGLEVIPEAVGDLPRQLFLRFDEWGAPLAILALALGGLGFALSKPSATPGRSALLLWGPLQLLAVAALEVAYYPWYAVPFFFSAALLVAQLAEGPWMRRLPAAFALPAATAAGAALLLLAGVAPGWQRFAGVDPRRAAYERVAELAASLPGGVTIAAFEVGFLGFRSQLPVLDLLGLVTPAADLAHVRSGDLHANVELLKPDLLMLTLNSGSLFGTSVGDVPEFVDEFRLERLQLGPGPALAVFRRAGSPTSGEVVLDLLPLLRAAGARVHGRELGHSALVAHLRGGESLTLFVPGPLPETRFVSGYAQDESGARLVAFSVDPDSAVAGVAPDASDVSSARRALPVGVWKLWDEPWPALPRGGEVTFRCVGRAEGSCDFALPHLARIAPGQTLPARNVSH